MYALTAFCAGAVTVGVGTSLLVDAVDGFVVEVEAVGVDDGGPDVGVWVCTPLVPPQPARSTIAKSRGRTGSPNRAIPAWRGAMRPPLFRGDTPYPGVNTVTAIVNAPP